MYKRKVNKLNKTITNTTNYRAKYNTNTETLGMHSEIRFGKYKYLYIKDVINRNPKYIVWCIENFMFKPSNEVINILIDKGLIKEYNRELNLIKK